MPFGLAVVPDVYSVKRRSSLSIASGSHVAAWSATRSWYQWSRPSRMGTSLPVRRTTTTLRIVSVLVSASSTLLLSGTVAPRRQASSWVIRHTDPESFMRSATASAEKPPNTTEWAAPMRAQASIATGSSGTMPM